MQSKLSMFLSIVLKIIFIGGILLIPFLPKIYDFIINENLLSFHEQTIFYQIAFYSCYLISLSILYVLITIFKKIYKETPFNPFIEKSLKKIAILFMFLAILIGIKSIFIPTILSIAICFIAFIVSLCFYVLSQIFKVAIEYKKEIDFTV